MTKILIDESVEGRVVAFFRLVNQDVSYVSEIQKGISDEVVLEMAFTEKRLLVTNDTDFAKLVFSQKLPNHGVVLLRFIGKSSREIVRLLKNILTEADLDSFENKFTVISEAGLKIRTE